MKKILFYTFICLSIVIVLDKTSAFIFKKFIFEHTYSGESGGTINYVLTHKSDVDFLIMGASRAKHGVDPRLLTNLGTNGYNLGINGTTVINSYLILDLLVQHSVVPHTILLQTDLFEYDETKEDARALVDQIKRLYPYDTKEIRSYVREAGTAEQFMYMSDLYKFNRKMANIGFNFLKRKNPDEANGYVGLPDSSFPKTADKNQYTYAFSGKGQNIEALKRMQKLCDEHNIQLVVVFQPSYQNILFNEENQTALNAIITENRHTTLIDYSDIKSTPLLQDEHNWRDAVHFNSTGAATFSKILNERLKFIK